MLRPRSEVERLLAESSITPYMDPRLRFTRREYVRFAKKLVKAKLFGFRRNVKARVAPCFVWKSGRTKIRMIIDARRGNLHFVDPLGVQLCWTESLARIQRSRKLTQRLHTQRNDDVSVAHPEAIKLEAKIIMEGTAVQVMRFRRVPVVTKQPPKGKRQKTKTCSNNRHQSHRNRRHNIQISRPSKYSHARIYHIYYI